MSINRLVVIIGAGPAGLTAAHEAIQRDMQPIVLEKAAKVGGLARTEIFNGYHFDVGGHRFYTKVEEVMHLWQEVLGKDFVTVPRRSRIYYLGRYFNYPLDLYNTLSNLGLIESSKILLSYLKSRLNPYPEEENFEQWVINRFGRRIYQMFFQTYTEKVWGIPCHQIKADWAAQRIKGLSLRTAVAHAIFGNNNVKTLVNVFYYPILGSGMMWQRFQEAIENQGGEVLTETEVVRLERDGERITGVVVNKGEKMYKIMGSHFISSMPLNELITRLDPLPPENVLHAARGLRYRALILVGLIVNQAELFPDNWIYVHSPEVQVGRIQNFKNWSTVMVPDPQKTSLGLEYFCAEGDALWQMSDSELIELATQELVRLRLADVGKVEGGTIIRQPQAYPMYDADYLAHLEVVRSFLTTIYNLQTIGRNGMHRYNNQDHSMLTGILAVRNLLGGNHDLWNVNVERSYHEEFATG